MPPRCVKVFWILDNLDYLLSHRFEDVDPLNEVAIIPHFAYYFHPSEVGNFLINSIIEKCLERHKVLKGGEFAESSNIDTFYLQCWCLIGADYLFVLNLGKVRHNTPFLNSRGTYIDVNLVACPYWNWFADLKAYFNTIEGA